MSKHAKGLGVVLLYTHSTVEGMVRNLKNISGSVEELLRLHGINADIAAEADNLGSCLLGERAVDAVLAAQLCQAGESVLDRMEASPTVDAMLRAAYSWEYGTLVNLLSKASRREWYALMDAFGLEDFPYSASKLEAAGLDLTSDAQGRWPEVLRTVSRHKQSVVSTGMFDKLKLLTRRLATAFALRTGCGLNCATLPPSTLLAHQRLMAWLREEWFGPMCRLETLLFNCSVLTPAEQAAFDRAISQLSQLTDRMFAEENTVLLQLERIRLMHGQEPPELLVIADMLRVNALDRLEGFLPKTDGE
ncbi:hypothetical protein COHA_008931 [Chlorella ohadii]|uniref:Uncharacterized protein n=1 Tax=Chlorella ohadii TaxID=2649997 RepID=A0AAD5H147_9CHLO|nr:hypothetical protein COHA_008931 [Chlorella ohadii]